MHFYLSVNVFSMKVLIGDTIFTSPNGEGLAACSADEVLSFLSHFKTLRMVRPRESNPRPPALQSNALPAELILPRL